MILVAGGTGLLGSRLVRRLRERGTPVRVLMRSDARAAGAAAEGAEIVHGDLRDAASVRAAANGVTTIVGAAHGFLPVGGSTPDSVDRLGNQYLVDAATAVGADVVLMSVVGASANHPIELFRAKHAAEQYLSRSGVSATVVRATAFVETWVGVLGEPLQRSGRGMVFGRGRNPINFVSVDAVAALLERATVDRALRSETLEVGGPDNISMIEFATLLCRAAGVDTDLRHVPRAVLRAMAAVAGIVKPSFARQLSAAIAMDSRPMSFDATAICARFPEIPQIQVADVIRAAHGASALASLA